MLLELLQVTFRHLEAEAKYWTVVLYLEALSFDPTSGIGITADKDKAVMILFPPSKRSEIPHLDMVCHDKYRITTFDLIVGFYSGFVQVSVPSRLLPYLGLALLVPRTKDQNVIPDTLPGVTSTTIRQQAYHNGNYWAKTYTSAAYYGVSEPSSSCKGSLSGVTSNCSLSYSKVDFVG